MKFVLILSSLLAIQAGVIKEEICDGIIINGVYHEPEILHEGLDRPYLLTVDLRSNVLYFSYSITADDDQFITAKINLDTKEFKRIEGVTNGFAQAADRNSHDVYIGGSDGLYKYDPIDDKATFIGEKDVNIWTVYYKDVLYYSVFPRQFFYTFENGESKRFPDLEDTKVDHFLIDNNDYIYFTNDSGLYSQKKGTKDAVMYNCPHVGVRGLALDTKGTVHVCMQDGIYIVNKDELTVEKVVEIDDAFGLAFDKNNNIVYSDATRVIRLVPNPVKKCQ